MVKTRALPKDEAALNAFKEEVERLRREKPRARLYLVLEGDWGGQIFLTIPCKQVGPKAKVATLLRKINWLAWHCNCDRRHDDGSTFYVYPARSNEKGVGGGMGGGALTKSLWLHKEFVNPEFPPHDKWTKLRAKTDWQKLATQLLDIQS